MRNSFVSLLLLFSTAGADEGMWPFSGVPSDAIRARHGFAPDAAWLDRLRLASVRFTSGGSGSFVGPDGLVITNHHVGADCIQKVGIAGKDYVTDGFYAPTREQEIKCPDLELNVLMSIEDVTAQVQSAIKPGTPEAAVNREQKAAMARIEKQCADTTGLRCDVVTLYQGMAFHLYRYQKMTDVRLVFAPEADIAFFGGDPDNFTYPRFDLDIAFFHVYRDGKPVHVDQWLPVYEAGPAAGDLVFVSGNPGTTGRLLTMAQLELLRDTVYPFVLDQMKATQAMLHAFAARDAESARIAQRDIFGIENSIKATTGFLSGLHDAELMHRKQADELTLRSRVAVDDRLRRELGDPWEALDKAEKKFASFYTRYAMLETTRGLDSDLFRKARGLLRMTAELKVENDKRLREYRESNLESIKLGLYSEAPMFPAFEQARLQHALSRLQQALGPRDPLVKKILDGRTPEDAARAYVGGSKLFDVAVRRALSDPDKSDDPMIRLARLVDPEARRLRKRFEDEVEGVERVEGAKIARLLFQLDGTSRCPDATFTLRLAYGAVLGYQDGGKTVEPFTTMKGLYRRATGQPPYRLPQRWVDRKGAVGPDVKMNFVSTADIHGGNSGSPVVDCAGRFVGIIFDSNIFGLPNRFVYTDTRARAVAVHAQAILHALRQVYGASELVGEIENAAHRADAPR
jgi:peptidase S46-like protein